MIRRAIEHERAAQDLTVYKLWQLAKPHAPTITQTAIGEYLAGQREVNTAFAESMLIALGLGVAPTPKRKR